MERGAYGQSLADCFRLERAPTFVSRALRHSIVAATWIDCDIEDNGLTEPLPREDALLVTLQLRDCPKHDLWIDGKATPTAHLPAGTTCVYDLRCNPIANSISPFRQVAFYFPRRALAMAAEDDDGPQVDTQWHNPGLGMNDGVIRGLGLSLLPAFEHPDQAMTLFVDHVTTAAAAYIVRLFGSAGSAAPSASGLAPWQERRAKELLRARLDGSLSIARLARECGQSPRTFSEAFRKATGVLPHQWLMIQRIEAARALLRTPRSLASIAAECGFSSEAHLTRVFRRLTGRTPRT
jgi:AraC family transcriptional regulator